MDGAIFEIFTVKVLASVAGSMSCVSDYWNSHFWFIWKSKWLSGGIAHNWILLSWRQFIVLRVVCNIVCVQFWSQGINVEKWIFSVIYLGCWHSVQTFETLISNSWEVHIRSSFLDFYALEPIQSIKMNKKMKNWTYSASWKL